MVLTELEEKTQRIVAMLSREGLGAVLLNGQHNFAWLTGGRRNGIDMSRENGAASLLITKAGNRYLIANNIEMRRMQAEEVSLDDFEPVEIAWQDEKAVGDAALMRAREFADGEIATDIPLFAGASAIEGKIAACRFRLTAGEVERYRQLGRDAGAAINVVIRNLSRGESERAVARTIRTELARKDIVSVVTLVAADERISNFRHPVPTEKTWYQTLLMVTCAKRFGLIVSLSRLVCVGRASDELTRKTEAAAFVNAAILDATRPGTSGSDIYALAAQAYADAGFAGEIDLHHQGGAAGYKTRDWVAHPRSIEIVEENQAFAWNPSITGTKVEETVIATGSGVEVITASPDFPPIVTKVNGREYFSPGVLSI